jgi:hypothetical protein
MRVFLSWSGERSRQLGEAISKWLPYVHPRAEVFFSPDIEKGVRWDPEIEDQLRNASFCIVCLTGQAMQSPWINFETGAISQLGEARIASILFELTQAEVSGPLERFQLVDFLPNEMHKLMISLNNASGAERLRDGILDHAFCREWPDLKKKIDSILQSSPSEQPPKLTGERIADETLLNTREILKQIGKGSTQTLNRRAIADVAPINKLVTRLYRILSSEESAGLKTIENVGRRLVALNDTLGKRGGESLVELRKWTEQAESKEAPDDPTQEVD